ncbi:MAG: sulfatase-like hydrolase/transferase [Proteobacteria bacterium]|nr:sulfatase-like hydrolase/transferase [Pseudomonadota bacterium]
MRSLCPAILLLASCGGAPSEAPPAPAEAEIRPNVVFVTLDTVRVDRIGAYGYDKAATPTLDALAAKGQRFDRAFSPFPLTIPSHSSMMTGLYPPQHGVRDNGDNVLEEDFVTLAESLKSAGYDTAGSVAAFVTSRQWGFNQGFDAYFDDVPRADDFWHASRRGEVVVDDLIGWLETRESEAPAFVWAHLYDAHMPFEPPSPYKEAHEGRPYDGEIAYVDDQLARLVKAFEGEKTIFVVAADHGEGLGEHFEMTHGLFVFNSTQHVPMVISGHGIPAEVVSQPVSLVDIMPTILDHVGVEIPEGLAGRPVPSDEERPVYMESWQLANRYGLAPHVAVVSGDDKFFDLPQPELYALTADHGESKNRAENEADRATEMKAIMDSFGFEAPSGDQAALSSEVSEELAALGYVVGARPDKPIEDLPDPKEHLHLIREMQKTDRRMSADPEDALKVLRELGGTYPEIVEVKVQLCHALMAGGHVDEAEKVVREALKQQDSPQLSLVLSTVLLAQANYDDAAVVLMALKEERTFSPRFRVRLLQTLFAADRADEAEPIAAEFMREYPTDLEVPGVLGVYLARSGREAEGLPHLERAVKGDRVPGDVAFVLGMHAAAQKNRPEAIRYFELEVENHPFNERSRRLLATYAMEDGNWDAWFKHAAELVRIVPRDPRAHEAQVQALFNLGRYDEARIAMTGALALAPGDAKLVLLDANLLAKEGKRDEGLARFEEAKKLAAEAK